MHIKTLLFIIALVFLTCSGCKQSADSKGTDSFSFAELVVNSLDDIAAPRSDVITLRSALNNPASHLHITFDPSLDGGTINLTIVGDEHAILMGEVMGMRDEPTGPVSFLVGYFERDYGKTALYARKNITIDASGLQNGITIAWTGVDSARVLSVYGNLTMRNIAITGGNNVACDISRENPDQPWTLSRGGAIAVWGRARLIDCTIYGNSCEGDFDSSRDRGAFGGGLYANEVEMFNCIVSGNTVLGGGAAGGGVFSVGGASASYVTSILERCVLTGNRITGLFAYGAGVYSDGGGIGNSNHLYLINCTIARNLVEPPPSMPPFLLGIGYWRGGGIYMSNGYLQIKNCTIVENQVYGLPRTDVLEKPNMAGAGIAATIGNAHAVEEMRISHSIITGNTIYEMNSDVPPTPYNHDIFTGSLLHFRSDGFNRIGVIDFSQILVPVGYVGWQSLCRKHYPKNGDQDGVLLPEVLDLINGILTYPTIPSRGVDAPNPVPISYAPLGNALDQIPDGANTIAETYGEYEFNGEYNDFLEILLARLETYYNLQGFAATFTTDFENFLNGVDIDPDTPELDPYLDVQGNPILTLPDVQWFGPPNTWNTELCNYPYIEFWHHLDAALIAENIPGMGPEVLGDAEWRVLFGFGPLFENPDIIMNIFTHIATSSMASIDQNGIVRPVNGLGDIGAIELP